MGAPIIVGVWGKVFAFSEELVPSQKYRTKFAAMASALVTVVPVPLISVLTNSLLSAASLGMVTLGVAPKFPLTVTELFALGFGLALALDQPAGVARTP